MSKNNNSGAKFLNELEKEIYEVLAIGASISESNLEMWRKQSPYYHLLKEFIDGNISGVTLKLALDGIIVNKDNEENSS